MRRLFLAVGASLIAFAGYLVYLGVAIWHQSHVDQYLHADAIVVLGAAQYNGQPSPVLKARLDHAFYLYDKGLAPLVITTGGKQPTDRFTEADTEARYLEAQGVPASHVMSEDTGRTTLDSMENVARIARHNGIDSVLLVSDPLHSERVKTIALALGFKSAYTSPDSYLDLHRSRTTKITELMHEVGSLAYYQLWQRWVSS